MAQNSFISCDGLVKIYKIADLEVVALQGLDLEVPRGELLGIVGVSGSGKSTLMNILGGMDRPSAGKVTVNGSDLLKMSDSDHSRYRRSKVGFVWQQGARNLIPYLSALENVELPMTLAGTTTDKHRRSLELLDVVGLSERVSHHLIELSGGEQQRVAIAVALANEPVLLLADEPTGEVDTTTAAGIFKVFQDLNQHLGLTILIVSHDQGISRYVNRVVAIRDGKTSSETVRQSTVMMNGAALSAKPEHATDEVYEELVVLDSAGRLQVPRDYLLQHNIKDRARLEVTADGILIRAVTVNNGQAVAGPHKNGDFNEEAVDVGTGKAAGGLRGWWQRVRGKKDVR
jgi:ABC-type lipoprotein export system ATPase subunit